MRFGVVIHGPEVVDSGQAKRILDILSRRGFVRARLGGTMGRTAVIDASLENRIDIEQRLRPSEALESLARKSDVLFLLNSAKTRETGLFFGSAVVSKLRKALGRPLLQMDEGYIVPWNPKGREYVVEFAEIFGLEILEPPRIGQNLRLEGDKAVRKIIGVEPGENIWVNGVVIGRAFFSEVEIISQKGRIIEVRGCRVKAQGLERLEAVDLGTAVVRSGVVRRSKAEPRVLERKKYHRAVIIDHSAEASLELARKADIAVTIGDDTTKIAGDILYRLGVPIIGLTDGDIDGIALETRISRGSVILRLKRGVDDITGKRIRDKLFKGALSRKVEDFGELMDRVIEVAGEDIEDIRSF